MPQMHNHTCMKIPEFDKRQNLGWQLPGWEGVEGNCGEWGDSDG